MYISCTDPSCHNWFPELHKLVWQLGSVHKIHIHLEATSPLKKINKQFYNALSESSSAESGGAVLLNAKQAFNHVINYYL